MAKENKKTTVRVLELRSTEGVPEPGVWHSDFNAVRDAAVRTGMPLIGMWINPACGFCVRFCAHVLDNAFRHWMKESGAYFWLGSRTDADKGGDGYEFVFEQSDDPEIKPEQRMYFPGVAVWQCEAGKPDVVLHDYRASGRVFEKEQRDDLGTMYTIKRIERALTEPPYKTWVQADRGNAQPKKVDKPAVLSITDSRIDALKKIADIVRPFDVKAAARPNVPAIRVSRNLDEQMCFRIVHALVGKGGHCPCKPDKTEDTLCLCKEFRETGKCACGLFETYRV